MRRIKIGKWRKEKGRIRRVPMRGNPDAVLPTIMDLNTLPFQSMGTYGNTMFYACPEYLVVGMWCRNETPIHLEMMREQVTRDSKAFFGHDMVKLGCRMLKDEMPTPATYVRYMYLADATTFDCVVRDVQLYGVPPEEDLEKGGD